MVTGFPGRPGDPAKHGSATVPQASSCSHFPEKYLQKSRLSPESPQIPAELWGVLRAIGSTKDHSGEACAKFSGDRLAVSLLSPVRWVWEPHRQRTCAPPRPVSRVVSWRGCDVLVCCGTACVAVVNVPSCGTRAEPGRGSWAIGRGGPITSLSLCFGQTPLELSVLPGLPSSRKGRCVFQSPCQADTAPGAGTTASASRCGPGARDSAGCCGNSPVVCGWLGVHPRA